jgi:hypothetical protein
MEAAMHSRPISCALLGGASIALALLISPSALAADAASADMEVNAAPVVVAQALPAPSTRTAAPTAGRYPVYQRGVRMAAAEGPEALRRYIWRTRMIYNFYYYDFAP